MLGFFGISFHAANIPQCKIQSFERKKSKRFQKSPKISVSVYFQLAYIELSLCLSAFQKTFLDPKLDKIYLRKIAVDTFVF